MALDEWVCTLVVASVREHLSAAPLPAAYHAVLAAALTQRGNILAAAPDFRWTQPVVVCCTAAGGAADQAVPAAAAAEMAMVALDLLDDMEDGESNPLLAEFGTPVTLNATTGLLYLAQRVLLAADDGAALADCWLEAGLRSGGGQHADLTHTSAMGLSYEALLQITSAKSGSLMAGVCRLGARAAGASPQRELLFAEFGRLLGVTAQVANDMRGAASLDQEKTDVLLRRPTLPLAFVARAPAAAPAPEQVQPIADRGALCFAWTVADSYRCRARRLIPHLTDSPAARESLTQILQML